MGIARSGGHPHHIPVDLGMVRCDDNFECVLTHHPAHETPRTPRCERSSVIRFAEAARGGRGTQRGAGGVGPPTPADFIPVTLGAVPTPWPLCRRLAGPEGL